MRLDSSAAPSVRPLPPAAPPRGTTGPAPGRSAALDAGIVIPIRAFSSGSARLAATLSPERRAALARWMADHVVAAAGTLPVVIVSSDTEVLLWADGHGLATVDDPGSLDAAATAGVAWCRRAGLPRAVIAHADLPLARPAALEAFAVDGLLDVVAIVPCHRDDGSPVLSVPTRRPFPFAYGPGSLRRHARRATACGLALRVVRDPALAFDVDLPEDLAHIELAGSAFDVT